MSESSTDLFSATDTTSPLPPTEIEISLAALQSDYLPTPDLLPETGPLPRRERPAGSTVRRQERPQRRVITARRPLNRSLRVYRDDGQLLVLGTVNLTGVGIQLRGHLPAGRVAIILPIGRTASLQLPGEVVWQKDNHHGIRFDPLPPRTAAALAAYIETL